MFSLTNTQTNARQQLEPQNEHSIIFFQRTEWLVPNLIATSHKFQSQILIATMVQLDFKEPWKKRINSLQTLEKNEHRKLVSEK